MLGILRKLALAINGCRMSFLTWRIGRMQARLERLARRRDWLMG